MKNSLLNYLLITISVCSVALLSACDKKTDEVDPNIHHEITNLTITFTPESGGEKVVVRYRDLDGPEGIPASIDPMVLRANTRYTASIQLFDEKNIPTKELTEEYLKAGDKHEFFYTVHNADLSFTKKDRDINGDPIGFLTSVETGSPGDGYVRIWLKRLTTPKDPQNTNGVGEDVFNTAFIATIQ